MAEKTFEQVREEIKGKKIIRMATVNAMAITEALEIEENLKTRFNPKELIQADMSPVIGTHVGPGTVGVAFITED